MNYDLINPFDLPFIHVANKSRLPSISAVYFLISQSDEILYIGKTNSLFIRWANHSILHKTENPKECRIAYFQIAEDFLIEAETYLLYKFRPILNTTFPVVDKQPKNPLPKTNIQIRIKEVAQSRGIKTAYQLQMKTGVQPNLAAKWYRNDLKSIGIESLNKLCDALDCRPSGLLVYTPDHKTD